MIFYKLVFFWCLCSISGVYQVDAQITTLVAEFNSLNVNGTVLFSQTEDENVEISVENLALQNNETLRIHEFPLKYEGPMSEICKNIGGIFDPGNAQKEKNYSAACRSNKSSCAIGDLLNELNTSKTLVPKLSLSGQAGIFGRSLAIHKNNDVVACATINKNSSATKTVVGVFRAVSPGIAGTIVLRQAADDPHSNTAVDIKLMLVDARSEAMTGLSLAVFETASTSDSEGSCEGIGELYNLGKTSCDKREHSTCPIGDLSGKLGLLDIPLPGEGKPHSFYIDTNLPLSGENSVSGRSLVILSNGKPLICAKIQEYQEMSAEVALEDAQGMIGFTQGSLYEPVVVNVTISDGYHGIIVYKHAGDCTGEELFNTTNSGRMDELTMHGPNSIMLRSVAVSKTGMLSCKKIQPKNPTYHLKAQVKLNETAGFGPTGFVKFEQVFFDKSKAFAYFSSILMSVHYKEKYKVNKTLSHNWHVHLSNMDNEVPSKKCMSAEGHYNPYKVYIPDNNYASTCNPSNPFRCELGDLSKKLGTYNIGGGLKQFTETENYLTSWHNIIGRSVVIHTANKGAGRLTCADVLPDPQDNPVYNSETLNVRNTSKTRDKESFQKVVSAALKIESWRVADVKYSQMKSDKHCLTYKFLLIDDSMSDLHRAFADLVDDDPDKLKEFTPACEDEVSWKINEGRTAEVVGVVFGLIILIIFVICMIFWLRKRRHEHDESSKLVEGVDVTTNQTAISIEKNDNPEVPSEPKKDWKVTTSL